MLYVGKAGGAEESEGGGGEIIQLKDTSFCDKNNF